MENFIFILIFHNTAEYLIESIYLRNPRVACKTSQALSHLRGEIIRPKIKQMRSCKNKQKARSVTQKTKITIHYSQHQERKAFHYQKPIATNNDPFDFIPGDKKSSNDFDETNQ